MNKTRSDTGLDELLRRWADSRRESGDLKRLQAQILATCREQAGDDGVGQPQPSADVGRGPQRRGWSAVWFAAGAIAATVVALCCYSLLGPRPDGPNGAGPLPPELVVLQESELAEKVVLANEMDKLFGDRFQWIGETADRVLLEVGESDTTSDADGPRSARLAVRVIAVRRGADEEKWTPIWAADLVTRQEQVVRLTPDPVGSPDGADFSLWAYALDDDTIVVDSELSLGEVSLSSTFNGVQRSGVPVTMHTVQQDAVQYCVFQTVVILDGEA
jgi:hypothetical protein